MRLSCVIPHPFGRLASRERMGNKAHDGRNRAGEKLSDRPHGSATALICTLPPRVRVSAPAVDSFRFRC